MISPAPITLFSSSPRRRELLERAGIPFRVFPVDIDETPPSGPDVGGRVAAVAVRKLTSGLSLWTGPEPDWSLAADTVIHLDGRIVGKPADPDEARATIRALSGRSHEVISALALRSGRTDRLLADYHETRVAFRDLSEKEIDAYVATGEWMGAAGGYRIQSRGSLLIHGIDGLWSGVVGLPLGLLYGMLSALSYPWGWDRTPPTGSP